MSKIGMKTKLNGVKLLGKEEQGKVEIIKGDLLKSNEIAIGHGCNCFNTMGKGIALSIKNKYPDVYKADLETKKGSREKLGKYSCAFTEDGRYIFNLYTQYTYWDKNDMFYKEALEESLCNVFKDNPIKSIAIPAIGTGLANGNFEDLIYTCLSVADKTGKTIRIYLLDKN